MFDDTTETPEAAEKFNYPDFPEDTLFHDRRETPDRRGRFPARREAVSETPRAPKERRVRKERRRRIDPTTFEKQYTEDELEFMNAMQRFKVQSCKSFPSHGEVLQVAYSLGYRKVSAAPSAESGVGTPGDEPPLGLVSVSE
jgi:hypothetical protein